MRTKQEDYQLPAGHLLVVDLFWSGVEDVFFGLLGKFDVCGYKGVSTHTCSYLLPFFGQVQRCYLVSPSVKRVADQPSSAREPISSVLEVQLLRVCVRACVHVRALRTVR